MTFTVEFHEDFDPEVQHLPESVQDDILALSRLLAVEGPRLGRPHCDTLKGSRYANLKELRLTADGGAWRVAFAFDPRRSAILLLAGNKSGVSQDRFYRMFIRTAERRFSDHLERLKSGGGK